MSLKTLMILVAVVAGFLGVANESIVRYARSGHARFHEGRARWFAVQAEAYRGGQSGVRAECLRLADWHRRRAEQYRRSRKYDHEAEMIEDGRQIERENGVDRLLVIDRKARAATAAAKLSPSPAP